MCQEELSHGYFLTVILNTIQDQGFANYSRVFINHASVLLFTQYQKESLENIFSLLCFTEGDFCHKTDKIKATDKDKILI